MDKVFQIIFMIIMTVGILGLPAYYFLNSRRKKIVSEFEEEPENPVGLDSDELDPDDGDFESSSDDIAVGDSVEYDLTEPDGEEGDLKDDEISDAPENNDDNESPDNLND